MEAIQPGSSASSMGRMVSLHVSRLSVLHLATHLSALVSILCVTLVPLSTLHVIL